MRMSNVDKSVKDDFFKGRTSFVSNVLFRSLGQYYTGCSFPAIFQAPPDKALKWFVRFKKANFEFFKNEVEPFIKGQKRPEMLRPRKRSRKGVGQSQTNPIKMRQDENTKISPKLFFYHFLCLTLKLLLSTLCKDLWYAMMNHGHMFRAVA